MTNFRSETLRRLAKDIPSCQLCGAYNHGQVIGAHSNRLADGKGRGLKAHDLVAYVCEACHAEIDGEGDRQLRHNQFLQAYYNSTLWLLREGHLQIHASSIFPLVDMAELGGPHP